MRHFIVLAVAVMLMSCGTEEEEETNHEVEQCSPIEDTQNSYWVTYTAISETCGVEQPNGHSLRLGELIYNPDCQDYRGISKNSCTITWERDCASPTYTLEVDKYITFRVKDGETVPIKGNWTYSYEDDDEECYGIWRMNFRKL